MFGPSDDRRRREDSRAAGSSAGPAAGDLSSLERMPPGVGLAQVLADVVPTEVASAYDLVELVAATRRIKSWADGIEVETLAALAVHPLCNVAEAARHGFSSTRAAGQMVAARVGLAPSTGADRVATATQLVDELPDTVAALRRGDIDYGKAAALAVGVRQLEPPDGMQDAVTGESITPDGLRRGLVSVVEARVLPKAGGRSLRQHRDAINRAVAAVAPKLCEERHQRACEDRHTEHVPAADGMAWLNVFGPADDVAAIKAMVDAGADAARTADPDDPRTLDQLRVDVLAQLAWASLDAGRLGGCPCGPRLGRRHGRGAAVNVTVPITSLLGPTDEPGELAGYGPIPASMARRIAAHGTWRRLLTDPATSQLLDYGTTCYRPPQDLLDHLIARDKTCRFPTCSVPARHCQIDHTIPAGAPGWSTGPGNNAPMSGGCHNGKTHAKWHLEQPAPGHFRWRDPTGHRYQVEPEQVGPIVQHPEPPGDPPEPDVDDIPPF